MISESFSEEQLFARRKQLPKLFLLSNDDLIEILKTENNPESLSQHISKLNPSVQNLQIENIGGKSVITGLVSTTEGKISLLSPVELKQNVCENLKELCVRIKETLLANVKKSLETYGKVSKEDFIQSGEIAQVTHLVRDIMFTKAVEESLEKKEDLSNLLKTLQNDLASLIKLSTKALDSSIRQRLNSAMCIEQYSISLVQNLIEKGIQDPKATEWQSVLRAYWNPDNKVTYKIGTTTLPYGFEYVGNNMRLVITPMTVKIYNSLAQALQDSLGFASCGPAGTGKTETIKDLARTIGKNASIVNCSDQLDIKTVRKQFQEICGGNWLIYDEFNRVSPDLLKGFEGLMKVYVETLKSNAKTIVLDGEETIVGSNCGVFLTMNPGYSGAIAIPESFKPYFKTIDVMVPETGVICEHILMCNGFLQANALSKKLEQLHKLLVSVKLGLKFLKEAIESAGVALRSGNNLSEEKNLVKGLRELIEKNVSDEKEKVKKAVSDVFPGEKIEIKRKISYLEWIKFLDFLIISIYFILKRIDYGTYKENLKNNNKVLNYLENNFYVQAFFLGNYYIEYKKQIEKYQAELTKIFELKDISEISDENDLIFKLPKIKILFWKEFLYNDSYLKNDSNNFLDFTVYSYITWGYENYTNFRTNKKYLDFIQLEKKLIEYYKTNNFFKKSFPKFKRVNINEVQNDNTLIKIRITILENYLNDIVKDPDLIHPDLLDFLEIDTELKAPFIKFHELKQIKKTFTPINNIRKYQSILRESQKGRGSIDSFESLEKLNKNLNQTQKTKPRDFFSNFIKKRTSYNKIPLLKQYSDENIICEKVELSEDNFENHFYNTPYQFNRNNLLSNSSITFENPPIKKKSSSKNFSLSSLQILGVKSINNYSESLENEVFLIYISETITKYEWEITATFNNLIELKNKLENECNVENINFSFEIDLKSTNEIKEKNIEEFLKKLIGNSIFWNETLFYFLEYDPIVVENAKNNRNCSYKEKDEENILKFSYSGNSLDLVRQVSILQDDIVKSDLKKNKIMRSSTEKK